MVAAIQVAVMKQWLSPTPVLSPCPAGLFAGLDPHEETAQQTPRRRRPREFPNVQDEENAMGDQEEDNEDEDEMQVDTDGAEDATAQG